MFMDTTSRRVKRKRGQQLTTPEKMALTESIANLMEEGILSVLGLAKRLNVNTTTIKRYKPYAQSIFYKVRVSNKAYHRQLLIERQYKMIERLTIDLESCTNISERMIIVNQMQKYYHLLAVITGVIHEAKVPTIQEHKQLVVIRPAMTH